MQAWTRTSRDTSGGGSRGGEHSLVMLGRLEVCCVWSEPLLGRAPVGVAPTIIDGFVAAQPPAACARSARMAVAGSMEARRRRALAVAQGRVQGGGLLGCALHTRCLWGGNGSQPQRARIYTLGGESSAATHPIALVYDVNRAVNCDECVRRPELRDMCGRGTGVRAPLRFRLPEMGLCNVM